MSLNTDNMIEISGCSLIKLVKAVYDLSNPQGLGFLHYEDGELSDDECVEIIEQPNYGSVAFRLDYIKGRACKMTVFNEEGKYYIYNQWYGHSDSQLKELLRRIGVNEQ